MFLLVKSNPTACSLHKCHTIADAAARLGENTSLTRVSFSSLAFFSEVIQLLSKPKNQYNLFTKNPFITKKNAQLFQDEVLSFLAHRTYLFPHPPIFSVSTVDRLEVGINQASRIKERYPIQWSWQNNESSICSMKPQYNFHVAKKTC